MEKEFAFPTVGKFGRDKKGELEMKFEGGIALLDYFAAKAMTRLTAPMYSKEDFKNGAKIAYAMAEAMMEERKNRIVKE